MGRADHAHECWFKGTGYRSLRQQFHAYVAVCVDGTVLSASIVEPTSTSFRSLGGVLSLRAGFTRSEALDLADDLASPLPVPLVVASSS